MTIKMRTIYITLANAALTASLLCVITSCEKELDFKYHDIDPLTVIEGELTPGGIKVGITMTTPMDEPMDRSHLTDAEVILSDLTADTSHTLHPDAEGYFTADVTGITGHDYRLTVHRDGCTYLATTSMYGAVEITALEFKWVKMPYDDVAILKCSFTDNPDIDGQCYWLRLLRNGETYQWGVADDRVADGGMISAITMTTRRNPEDDDYDTVLVDGDVVTFTVCPVSRPMYEYIEALTNGANGTGMFDGDLCLGYFMATSPASRTIVFHPDEIDYFK